MDRCHRMSSVRCRLLRTGCRCTCAGLRQRCCAERACRTGQPHTGIGPAGTFLAILRFFRGGLGAGGAFRFFSAGTSHPGRQHTVGFSNQGLWSSTGTCSCWALRVTRWSSPVTPSTSNPPVFAPGGGFGGAFCLAALPLAAAFAFGLLGDLQMATGSMTLTTPHSDNTVGLCSEAAGTGACKKEQRMYISTICH